MVNANDLGPDKANLPKCEMPSTSSSDSHPHVNSSTSALYTKNDSLKIVILSNIKPTPEQKKLRE
jgi:hypothetical protein